MPVLHRREDDSAFYLRGRVGTSWITWQIESEGQEWLEESGYLDGDTVDQDLLDTLQDNGWLYTGGSGPGLAHEGRTPTFLKVGEGAKHPTFGVGEIKELVSSGDCRVLFLREYPETRVVRSEDLKRVSRMELARERSAAYEKADAAKASKEASVQAARVSQTPDGMRSTLAGAGSPVFSSRRASAQGQRSASGCVTFLIGLGVLGVLIALLS